MVTIVSADTLAAPPPRPLDGVCSQCHKIWTLDTKQGVCQLCGVQAHQQTRQTHALRSIKSRAKRNQRQAVAEGVGYDQLEGEWLTFYNVAARYSHKAKAQDRQDLLHDILITLAEVVSNNGHKPITDLAMYRVASITVADYWRAQYKLTNGLDCGSCSKAQRKECRKDWLYEACPKAIKLVSLSQPIVDTEGNLTELGDTIADDKAIDLDAWLDRKTFLLGCPDRLILIAEARLAGIPPDHTDREYLRRWRQREQKRLF